MYKDRTEKLSELEEHYRTQPPFVHDDFRVIKQQQDKYELKKLLHKNLEKITLPSDRPQYGPGAIVPNSVLVNNRIFDQRSILLLIQAKLLWPHRQPKAPDHDQWIPPSLSEEQLQALEKNQPQVCRIGRVISSHSFSFFHRISQKKRKNSNYLDQW